MLEQRGGEAEEGEEEGAINRHVEDGSWPAGYRVSTSSVSV